MSSNILDVLANYNPSGFALNNQQRAATIADTEAATRHQQALARQEETSADKMQRELRDAEIERGIFMDAGAGALKPDVLTNPNAFAMEHAKRGGSGMGVSKAYSNTIARNTALAQMTEAQRKAASETHSQVGDILQAVQSAAPADRAAVYQQYRPQLEALEPGTFPQEYIGDNGLDMAVKVHKGLAPLLQQAQTKQQTATGAAQQQEAEARTAGLVQQNAGARRQQAMQELSQIVDPQTGTPSAEDFAAWQQKYADLAPAATPTRDRIAQMIRGAVPIEKQPEYDLNALRSRMGLMGNSEYDRFLGQYAKSLGKTPAQLTPEEGLASFQKFAEYKQDPQMRAAALAQKNLADTLKQIQIEQQPTRAQAQLLADDIINHRLAPDQISQIRGRGNGSLGVMVYEEAKRKDPAFNWEEAASEYQLSKNPGFQQTVRYMDYVDQSVDHVISAADKLANGNVRSLNAVKNFSKDQLNNVDLARFNTDRIEVADAIAKILQGGGSGSGTSDKKLEQAEGLLRSSDSPAVIRTTMQEIKSLIGNRRRTLTRGTFMENAAPAPTGSPSNGGTPKRGDTREYLGHTFEFDGHEWVRK